MKAIILFSICSLLCSIEINAQDVDVLLGTWKLDMSPQDENDSNFAMMEIKSVKDNQMEGTFYREGVKLREGRINASTGIIYGALISRDNSGEYNSTFFLQRWKALWNYSCCGPRIFSSLDSY